MASFQIANMKLLIPKSLYFILILTFFDYLLGMIMVDLMEVDTMQYASIAREMLDSGSFLEVYHRHLDYLDKPPLGFWLSSLSFLLLGTTSFAFRVPSLIFTILGAVSTYKLGKIYYNKVTGVMAAVILTTSQAWFLINNDPKTDNILAGAVIFAVWQLVEYIRNKKTLNFLLGFLGLALAMLQKGPIGLMVPVLAIGAELIYKKQWRTLFKWQWIVGMIFVLVLLSPMLWGLYNQFGWEGIRFYFWTQSFGRITGESGWENSAGYFYFVHTFLWAFLPWMVLAVYGTGVKLNNILKTIRDKTTKTEVLTLAGFLLPIIALSFSHFKLPQYIFVTFPFVAILTANAFQSILEENKTQTKKVFYYIHIFINLILWIFVTYLSIKLFPVTKPLIWAVIIVLFLSSVYFTLQDKRINLNILLPTALTIIGVNFLLNTNFYPSLLKYQSGTVIAHYAIEKNIPEKQLYGYKYSSHSLDFHLSTIVPMLENDEELLAKLKQENEIFLISKIEEKKSLQKLPIQIEAEEEFDSFRISLLSSRFLNPKTRPQVLQKVYLLRIKLDKTD